MPMERRPAHPVAKGARPGSRPQAHHVADKETFQTIAAKYGIPVEKLIRHNFDTLDPAEINWYLREYVGCKVPTQDGKNWRFSTTATPGLIFLPDNVMRMDPIAITGKVDGPVRLDMPGPISVLASNKFAHEFKIPPDGPRDLGYLLIQGRIAVEAEMKQEGGLIKTSLKKDQIKAGVEAKLSDVTKATFSVKFDEKSLDPIAKAVASGSKDGLLRAITAPFEASIKTTYRWGNLTVVPEFGAEASTTPVVIRVAGEFEDYMILEGARFKGKFVAKIGFNVGLSAKGWAWVADKVGRPVLQRFLATGGRALAVVGEWLVAEGVLFAGAIVIATLAGTLALTSLCAWLVADARRKGELTGLATWYVSAFTARVFGEERPTGFITGDVRLRDRLVAMGEADALTEARAALKRLQSPAANGTDAAALQAYRDLLIAGCGGRWDNAKIQVRVALEEKSHKLVGL